MLPTPLVCGPAYSLSWVIPTAEAVAVAPGPAVVGLTEFAMALPMTGPMLVPPIVVELLPPPP